MSKVHLRFSRRIFLAGGIAALGSFFVSHFDSTGGGIKILESDRVVVTTNYYYPLCDVGTIGAWLQHIATALPESVQLRLYVISAPERFFDRCREHNGKLAMVTMSFVASRQYQAQAATVFEKLDRCPIAFRCLGKTVSSRSDLAGFNDTDSAFEPVNRRSHVETIFSQAKVSDVFTALRQHLQNAPSSDTVFMVTILTGTGLSSRLRSASAGSGKMHGGVWTMWSDPQADAINATWHQDCLTKLLPFKNTAAS